MKLVAEISLYPLADNYIPPIKDFIARLNQYDWLEIETTSTSTRVSGDNLKLMQILAKEMQVTHEDVGQAIFVCKFLNGDKMN